MSFVVKVIQALSISLSGVVVGNESLHSFDSPSNFLNNKR